MAHWSHILMILNDVISFIVGIGTETGIDYFVFWYEEMK